MSEPQDFGAHTSKCLAVFIFKSEYHRIQNPFPDISSDLWRVRTLIWFLFDSFEKYAMKTFKWIYFWVKKIEGQGNSGKLPCSTPKASNTHFQGRHTFFWFLFSCQKFPISCAALAPLRLKVCLSFTFSSLLFFETSLQLST